MAKSISVWDGTQFVPANVPVAAVPNAVAVYNSASPTNAQVGTAWFDTNVNSLKVWSGSTWITVSGDVDLSDYLTQSSASATYAPQNSPTFTGTVSASTINSSQYNNASGISVIPSYSIVVNNGTPNTAYSLTVPTKSVCYFTWSTTAYSTSAGPKTANLVIDGVATVSSIGFYFNTTFEHHAFPTSQGSYTLNAGSYNLRITHNASSDSNDKISIFAIMVPTA